MADITPRRHGKPAEGARVVREHRLEQALQGVQENLGQKATLLIAQGMEVFHSMRVEPLEREVARLEARLARLEAPWWKRLAWWVEGWGVAVRLWLRPVKVQDEPAPIREETVPTAQAEGGA